MQWTNWSGSVNCNPKTISQPVTEAELQQQVRQASGEGKTIRTTGTGHSFVPLCAADEILISLDQMQGRIDSPGQGQMSFWAGTKLHQLGNISTQVAGLRLILASGEVVDCSQTQESALFKAAQLSLGLLGVVSQVTLSCPPAYHLHERTWVASFEECLSQLEQQIANNRHFEFFWSPGEDACAMKALNPLDLSAEEAQAVPILRETNGNANGRLTRYVREERIDRSYRIFPSERNLKFNEMEFALPAANGRECLCEIRELMQQRHPHVLWPIEYRTLAADDIWLSPAFGRETVTISIHQAADLAHQAFFADAEAIFRNHHGRPHWGKMHSLRADDLRRLYPQ